MAIEEEIYEDFLEDKTPQPADDEIYEDFLEGKTPQPADDEIYEDFLEGKTSQPADDEIYEDFLEGKTPQPTDDEIYEDFKKTFANFKEESAQIIQPDDTQDHDLQQVLEADGRGDLGLDKPKLF